MKKGERQRFWAAVVFVVILPWTVLAEEPVMDGLIGGEQPWEEVHDQALLEGRQAYNSDDLEGARRAFTAAIQAMPAEAAGYRNLARTLHWLEEYAEATAFYEYYLKLAPEAEDRATIEQERRAAAARAGGAQWSLPGDQRMALRSLERELAQGRAITAGGGGAWGLFQTLLRMGYAAPELAILRRDLEEKLFEEFEAQLQPREGFVPVMRSDGWQLQAERLGAIEELTRRESRLAWAERRRQVVQTMEALLGGRYAQAAELGAGAARENRDLPYLRWYQALAYEQSRRPAEALDLIEDLLFRGSFEGEARRQVEVLRAQLLQQMGRNEEAAKVYREILLGKNPEGGST